jgi:hypothetical protein
MSYTEILKLQKECSGERVRARNDDDVEENVETQTRS